MQEHAVGLALLVAELAIVVGLHLLVGDRQHLSDELEAHQGVVARDIYLSFSCLFQDN